MCSGLGASHRTCRCTPDQISRYQGRLSGPLLDRIDLCVEVPALPAAQLLQAAPGETSAVVRQRVAQARQRALARQGQPNYALAGEALTRHAQLSGSATQLLQHAATRLGWSGRATHRTMRVARTIADMAGQAHIDTTHLAEAMQYRHPGNALQTA